MAATRTNSRRDQRRPPRSSWEPAVCGAEPAEQDRRIEAGSSRDRSDRRRDDRGQEFRRPHHGGSAREQVVRRECSIRCARRADDVVQRVGRQRLTVPQLLTRRGIDRPALVRRLSGDPNCALADVGFVAVLPGLIWIVVGDGTPATRGPRPLSQVVAAGTVRTDSWSAPSKPSPRCRRTVFRRYRGTWSAHSPGERRRRATL